MGNTLFSPDSIRIFFEEALTDALKHQSLSVREETTGYIAELLCEFAIAQKQSPDVPLSVLVVRAAQSKNVDQLKEVGDYSLYTAGFYGEKLKRKAVNVEYYASVGETAYRRLSNFFESHKKTTQLSQVFSDLAAGFPQFVQVLTEVQEHSLWSAKSGGQEHPRLTDLPEIYEKWLRTHNSWAERQLREAGWLDQDLDGDDIKGKN